MHTTPNVGFIGLGNIGGPIASNVSAAGFNLIAYDAAGTAARLPKGASAAATSAQVACQSTILFMSLPNAQAVASVVDEIAGAADGLLKTVVDLSTVGVHAARKASETLARASISYLDAPVSGGVDGAKNRKIAVMCAGSCEAATALAATSEAVVFGLREGLAMLEVLNASSGRNTATFDKFPNHVATGKYASGFQNTLMNKDVGLYLKEAALDQCDGPMGKLVADIWRRFSEEMPACDFTRIYQFVTREIENSRKN